MKTQYLPSSRPPFLVALLFLLFAQTATSQMAPVALEASCLETPLVLQPSKAGTPDGIDYLSTQDNGFNLSYIYDDIDVPANEIWAISRISFLMRIGESISTGRNVFIRNDVSGAPGAIVGHQLINGSNIIIEAIDPSVEPPPVAGAPGWSKVTLVFNTPINLSEGTHWIGFDVSPSSSVGINNLIEVYRDANFGSEIYYQDGFSGDILSATDFQFGSFDLGVAFALCGTVTSTIPSMGQWAMFILLLSMMTLGVGYMFAGARNKGTVS